MSRKTKNVILAVAVSVAAIFIPAMLLGKWFEGVIFFVCHWLIREQYPRQYHHIVPAICRTITGATFFFGVSFILPFSLSLFSAVPINYFIGWVGFTKKSADVYMLKYERLKAELEKDKEFNTDTCTEAELVKRCEELNLSQDNVELAIEFFIKRTKQSEIADRLCIDEPSVRLRKYRLKQKLNKK